MANMRAIRTRIKSVKNTQQITKAMKMVAVSKLRKTQAGMTAMRPFAEKSRELLDTLLSGDSSLPNRFITPHKTNEKVVYVLFVGNRGLCGVYNNAVLRFAQELVKNDSRDCELVVCGRWGKDIIAKTGIKVKAAFSEISDTPDAEQAIQLADYLKNLYLSGEADEIHLVYQNYVSALRQDPTDELFLPARPTNGGNAINREFIFAPDKKELLESVMQLYLNNRVYAVMLTARCGEHSSRMTAMTAATDSTKELIGELGLSLNRARQAAITTEISEIVGGAEALKSSH